MARRRGPLRRFGDRRELPARRSAGPPRPAQDDGLARRSRPDRGATGAGRPSTAPSGSRLRCCILHGRKDKRVVPLMTERMVEALEIEGKTYEVQWYDEEGHGWERRGEPPRRVRLGPWRSSRPTSSPVGRTRHDLDVFARRSALATIGITLIEPSVSRTARRTSSMPRETVRRGRPPDLARPRRFSSRSALSSSRPSRTSRRGSPSMACADAARSWRQPLEPYIEPEQRQDRDQAAPQRRVLADHRVLDRVRDDEDDDQLEDRHLADLALAGQAQDDDEEQVDDGRPEDDLGQAGAEVG